MIVVTGVSGYVGAQLARRLGRPQDILLVSRDVTTLEAFARDFDVCNYEALRDRDLSGAVVIHLAVRNNDRPGTLDEFRAANVEHLLNTADIARRGGARRFINLCTTHALTPAVDDPYGQSKREGAQRLAAMWPEAVVNLYIPAVYGKVFQGRLAKLNAFPTVVRPIALRTLRLLKPVISIDNLAAKLIEVADAELSPLDSWRSERYAADPVPRGGLYTVIKRTIDLLAAAAVLLLAGWLMILVAIWVRLDSKGPAIFAQRRVGRHGRPFTCYKFRTMVVGTVQAATHETSASAITRAGGVLRRTKLDELPQIANVLFNQMTLIGPRPCLGAQTELLARRTDRGVLDLKPGISGLAQVNNIDMSAPSRLAAWDDRYGAFRTLLTDCAIMVRTVLGGGAGDRVPRAAP